MAIVALGEVGSNNNKTSGTTLAVTNTSASVIPAGTLLLMVVGYDNHASLTAATVTASATGGAAWTAHLAPVGSGITTSAGAGIWHTTFACRTVSDVATGGTLTTLTFSNAVVAKVAMVIGYQGVLETQRGTTSSATSISGTPSVATSGTAPVAGDLVIGCATFETSGLVTPDSDTLNGSWTSWGAEVTAGGGAANTNIAITVQAKVVTAGGAQTYNPSAANDSVASLRTLLPEPDPAATQAAYRVYADGTESAATALAAQDTGYTATLSGSDVALGLRTRLQSTNATLLPATDDWQLQWEKNASGTWADVGILGTLVDSYIETNQDSTLAQQVAGGGVGQSFLGTGTKLARAGFYLTRTGAPTGNLTARLYSHTGTFGGSDGVGNTLLATSITSVSVPSVVTGGTLGWYDFTFDGTFTLANGVPYVILISTDTAADGSNNIRVGIDGTSNTASGNPSQFDGAGAWVPLTGLDLIFRVYGPVSGVAGNVLATPTDGAATTNRLTAGTGSFVAGKHSNDGVVDNLGWTGNNYTEVLYSILLKQADLADADVLRFRVLRNGATTGLTYTQTPTLTVSAGAVPQLKTPADTAAGSDSATPVADRPRTPADTAAGSDSPGAVNDAVRTLGDLAGGTDDVSAVLSVVRTADLADTAAGADSMTTVAAAVRTPADTAAGADALTVACDRPRSVTDTAAGADLASTGQDRASAPSDIAAGADSATGGADMPRTPADTAAGADSVAALSDTVRSTGDTAAGSDAATTVAAQARSVDDLAGGVDSASAVLTVGVLDRVDTPADTAAGTDSLTAVQGLNVPLTDTAAGSDSLTASTVTVTYPMTLSGNLVWLRARDLVGANGAAVTSWPDQSGYANDLSSITGTTIVTGATPSGGRVARLSGGALPMDNPGLAARALVAHASSTFSPSSGFYTVDKLLDGDAATEWVASTNALPQRIKLRVVAGATVVTAYNLRAMGGQIPSAPAAWTFEGSNDGATWTTLDTQSGQVLSSAADTTYSFSNSNAYVQYRLNISARNGGTAETRFAGISLGGITTGALVAGGGEAWIVIKSNTTSGQWWQMGNSGQQSHYSFSGVVYDDFGTNVRDSFTPTMSISSAYRIVHVSITAAGVKNWEIDNVSQGSWSGRTLAWLEHQLLSVGWTGDYAETLVRSQVSTPAEIANIITYFNSEHGLTVSGGAGSVADAAAGSDAVTALRDAVRTLSDSAAGSDSLSNPNDKPISVTDTSQGLDALTVLWDRTRPIDDLAGGLDVATPSTIVGVNRAESPADTAAGVDAMTTVLDAVRTVTDSAAGADLLTTTADELRTPADTAAGADSVTVIKTFDRVVADLASGVDAVTVEKFGVGAETIADTAAGADALTIVSSRTLPSADTAAGADSLTAAFDRVRTQGDTAAGSDAASALLGDRLRTPADTAAGSDTASTTATRVRTVDDAAAGSDALTATSGLSGTLADLAGGADLLDTTWARERSVADMAGGTDAMVGVREITWIDSAVGSDALTATMDRVRTLSDTADGADAANVQRSSASGVTLADSAQGSDALTVTATRVRTIGDTAAGSDALARAMGAGLADTASGSDTAVGLGVRVRTIDDIAAGVDNLTAQLSSSSGVVFDDVANGSDALTATTTRAQTIIDLAGGTDAATFEWSRLGVLADTAVGSDALTAGRTGLVTITDLAQGSDSMVALLFGQNVGTPVYGVEVVVRPYAGNVLVRSDQPVRAKVDNERVLVKVGTDG